MWFLNKSDLRIYAAEIQKEYVGILHFSKEKNNDFNLIVFKLEECRVSLWMSNEELVYIKFYVWLIDWLILLLDCLV